MSASIISRHCNWGVLHNIGFREGSLSVDQDLVMEPFAGSNTTGTVAERMNDKWLAVDCVVDYLEGSKFRFG